ncbi:unnamed protein product (macronuclear) [Paramecium tetraurelia]|uniref:GTP-binding protein n=1 Tax=Paramecium tetraurelia TaxID=5888 RepID=A0BMQ1_PARTE|nr:uncharacterized protein GSPATT00030454001 [Paramecium tetraurelia]CAK59818.1 unnamed protein product [Paramecium tetraurelia]|eukprot:XP_001427216.1 hypothetical protein (macronuclear) [Paramecium tetraurelia strain d4-2]
MLENPFIQQVVVLFNLIKDLFGEGCQKQSNQVLELSMLKINTFLLYWDTTGQERYREILLKYQNAYIYFNHQQKATGVYLIYDITQMSTFDDVKSQLDKEEVIILICNKFDKVADNNQSREVSLEKASTTIHGSQCIFR